MKVRTISLLLTLFIITGFQSCKTDSNKTPPEISGIYPHLAYYNDEGECGTGAVVPWAGNLWVITYGPHLPDGSSDKLYEITPGLKMVVRPESIGGTPANRMIHRESGQLFIGPYAIDSAGNVRVIPYNRMRGRHTGNARHLKDPANKIYYATMEEGFYEVDVHSLEVNTLYADAHDLPEGEYSSLLPGAHGKGLYSGQRVLVYSNNGETGPEAKEKFDIEAGVLAEWDGKNWKIIRRNQFVEVSGPGGIHGNPNPETDPVWTTGWDHKSALIGVRDASTSGWSFFRIPKASHSYDGAHGWNTEWPRIRNVGTENKPFYLMTMHGMFWEFPETFSKENSTGIKPLSAYLKVIGDFTRWGDRLVFGCDDSAQKEFLNKRSVKGNIEGPGQSNSNLWFTSPETPKMLGPNNAAGAVWLEEEVTGGIASEAFLFSGWEYRSCWLQNHSELTVSFRIETDNKGTGEWRLLKTETLSPGESRHIPFNPDEKGVWIRLQTDQSGRVSAAFNYREKDKRKREPAKQFSGLSKVDDSMSTAGLLYGLGNNRRVLGISGREMSGDSIYTTGYYELDSAMNLTRKQDTATEQFIDEKFAIPEEVIRMEASSILIIDDQGRRWRLPKGSPEFTKLTGRSHLRIAREVATERDLFNCHGTFYELPAENADGFAKIRPVASHNLRIHDYASYRGMLIMTGIDLSAAKDNPRIFVSEDGKAAIWAGVIDDLWELGKPTGSGGPWLETPVNAGVPSDPYLIGFYDKRSLKLSHDMNEPLRVIIEVDPTGHGPWMKYKEILVSDGEVFNFKFPENFDARWIRFISTEDGIVSAQLEYE